MASFHKRDAAKPFGFSLLSLSEAIKGSKTASTSLPDVKITDMIFSTPNNNSCGTNGVNPELLTAANKNRAASL